MAVHYSTAPDPLAGIGVGPPGKGKKGGEGEKEGREGNGGEGVPECPNPELASLHKKSLFLARRVTRCDYDDQSVTFACFSSFANIITLGQ